MIKIINHSKTILEIAVKLGWLPGARYTNLRDIKNFDRIGMIDVEWDKYDFEQHYWAVKKTNPILTCAHDILNIDDLDIILKQANLLSRYCHNVIIIPKCIKLDNNIEKLIPSNYLLGYSVPTAYGGTQLGLHNFRRPCHILGGRPDAQVALAKKIKIHSIDGNRITLDAKFGKFFNGDKFVLDKQAGYKKLIEQSLFNINRLWQATSQA